MKKILALVLTVLILLSSFVFYGSAQEESNSFTVKMINYNVAGLPNFSGKDVAKHQGDIAEYLVENNFDIIAVQEDFGYHKNLVAGLVGYNHQTNHSGSIPGGDGLNIFTKNMPIYNEARYEWDISYGPIAEGDTLTPKGIIHTVIDVGNGVYVDFYNIHADAFDTFGSQLARESNYTQLADLIDENYEKYGRPVIVTGDFNAYLHYFAGNSNMYEIFHERCQLKDAWVEIKNDGDYHNYAHWYDTNIDPWGNWDSVEKFMYKDGKGVKVEAVEFEYKWLFNENQELLSDHAAAECVIEFTIEDGFVSDNSGLAKTEVSPMRNILNVIKWIFKDLVTVFTNIDELLQMLG